jgi:hypothetical protein
MIRFAKAAHVGAVALLVVQSSLQTAGAQAPTADGSVLRNQLASSKSPYLRSAARQPVAWQPWGPDAFALAARLDRPIWLDIGAVWCHWCHVMDRESYENPEIAALINRDFVAVKVDRDERPDIDARYQAAHIALVGAGGGWPLTMFLAPNGEPFFSGTYFPPDTRGGQDGLRVIAPRIAKAYHDQRPGAFARARSARQQVAAARLGPTAKAPLNRDIVAAVTRSVSDAFDPMYGGLGNGPGSKFADAESIRLGLAEAFLAGNDGLKRKALQSLDAYARSGMRDHVNGGFFRYSVNRELTVPHFEKMDYVQSALLEAYLDAYRLSRDSSYADVARDIMRYVNSTLSDHTRGGFYAHQDADISLDDDGSYYTWSLAQVEAALSADQVKLLAPYYDVEKKGEVGSHPDQNVLRIIQTSPSLAKKLKLSEGEVRDRIRRGTSALEAARSRQTAPFVERTEFTDRNAMMISAYLHAYETLQDTAARDFALKTLDFLLARALQADNSLRHATADGESYVPGLLLDYVLFADASLDAYAVTAQQRYLTVAERLMDRAVALFWDARDSGFFDRSNEDAALALLADRAKLYTDSPLPGDNAVAARVLDKLYLMTSQDRWRELADKTFSGFGDARKAGTPAATYALALEAHLTRPPQVVIIGAREDRRMTELATAARTTFRPGRMVTVYDPTAAPLDSLPDAVAGAARVFAGDRTPRAYVCVGETCAPPTTSPAEVVTLVRDYGRVGPK